MTLLFDATILVDGELDNGARSGVYFVAKNVLEGFLKKPGVNVILLAYPTRNAGLHNLVKNIIIMRLFCIKQAQHQSQYFFP